MAHFDSLPPPGFGMTSAGYHSEPESATKSRERRRVALVVREMSCVIDETLAAHKQEIFERTNGMTVELGLKFDEINKKFDMILEMLGTGYGCAAQLATSNSILQPPVLAWCAMKPCNQTEEQPEPELSPQKSFSTHAGKEEEEYEEIEETNGHGIGYFKPQSHSVSVDLFNLYDGESTDRTTQTDLSGVWTPIPDPLALAQDNTEEEIEEEEEEAEGEDEVENHPAVKHFSEEGQEKPQGKVEDNDPPSWFVAYEKRTEQIFRSIDGVESKPDD